MLGASDATVGDGVAMMQVGPMRSDLQPPGTGGDQGVFVGLRGRQGGGGIQLVGTPSTNGQTTPMDNT
jgi:hypothetical protein